LFVTLPGEGNKQVDVLDATGRRVMSHRVAAMQAQRMDVSSLAPGTYVLRTEGAAPVRFTKR
jgi:hypothetical protein